MVAPYVTLLPLAVVSALLFLVAWGLIDFAEMRRIWQSEPEQRAPLLVTGIATISLSLEWAIILGIGSAVASKWLSRRRRAA